MSTENSIFTVIRGQKAAWKEVRWGVSQSELQRCERLFLHSLCWTLDCVFLADFVFLSGSVTVSVVSHTRAHTHTLDVKPYFGKPPPTSAIVRHAFRHSWHVYLMPIIELFFLFPRVFWVDGVHRLRLLCYVPTLQTETRFLLMHFPVSLVIQIFEATNTGVINQTEEEQSQPQQVLRGNHLSSCEAGFAVCVCVIIKLFMAS